MKKNKLIMMAVVTAVASSMGYSAEEAEGQGATIQFRAGTDAHGNQIINDYLVSPTKVTSLNEIISRGIDTVEVDRRTDAVTVSAIIPMQQAERIKNRHRDVHDRTKKSARASIITQLEMAAASHASNVIARTEAERMASQINTFRDQLASAMTSTASLQDQLAEKTAELEVERAVGIGHSVLADALEAQCEELTSELRQAEQREMSARAALDTARQNTAGFEHISSLFSDVNLNSAANPSATNPSATSAADEGNADEDSDDGEAFDPDASIQDNPHK